MRRRHDDQAVFTPGMRFKIGMAREALNPAGIAFELANRIDHMLGVAHRHVELRVRVPPGKTGDERRQHVIAHRKAGIKLKVDCTAPGRVLDMPDLDASVWLARLSRDPSPAVRAATIRAAGEGHDAQTPPWLTNMAESDPSPTVKQLARYYLRESAKR